MQQRERSECPVIDMEPGQASADINWSVFPADRYLSSLQFMISCITSRLEAAHELQAYLEFADKVEDLLEILRAERTIFWNIALALLKTDLPDGTTDWWQCGAEEFRIGMATLSGTYYRECTRLTEHVSEIGRMLNINHDEAPWSTKNQPPFCQDCHSNDMMSNDPSVARYAMDEYARMLLSIMGTAISNEVTRVRAVVHRIIALARRVIRQANPKPPKIRLKSLEMVRAYAQVVSRVMAPHFGFHCRCKTRHRMFLRMDDMVAQSSQCYTSEELSERLRFMTLFYNCPPVNQKSSSGWHWSELAVRVDASGPHATNVSSESLHLELKPEKQSFVSFAKETLRKLPMAPKLDLCLKLKGFVVSPDIQSHQAIVIGDVSKGKLELFYQTPRKDLELWNSIGSFHALFKRKENAHPIFSVDEKLRLAFETASSLLHLYSTKWWRKRGLSSRHINVILRNGRNPLAEAFLPLEESFEREIVGDGQDFNVDLSGAVSPIILALGIFLIELAWEQPWERIRDSALTATQGDFDLATQTTPPDWENNLATDLAAANAINQHLSDSSALSASGRFVVPDHVLELGPLYIKAIRNCICCDFGLKTLSLENDGVRKAIYENIVHLLCFALEDHLRELSSDDRDLESQLGYPTMSGEPTLFDDEEGRPESLARAEKWFKKLEDRVHSLLPPPPIDPEKGVKIAILDSGVDQHDPYIASQWNRIRFRSFIPNNDRTEDRLGHGTHAAALILRVAPNATVYIGRVTVGKSLKSAQWIADGIDWACEEGADIISLSLGFTAHTAQVKPLARAIRKAHGRDILMFAATSNGGGDTDRAFPANQTEVIGIGSTDGKGNKSSYTPGPFEKMLNFTTLGEGVRSSWPSNAKGADENGKRVMSGTSFATPIAAAIAAFVIDYLKAVPDTNDYTISKLNTKVGMQAVLMKMSRLRDGCDYIVPWILFNEARKDRIPALLLDVLVQV